MAKKVKRRRFGRFSFFFLGRFQSTFSSQNLDIGVEVFLFKLCVRFNHFRVTLSVSVRVMFSVIVRDKVSVKTSTGVASELSLHSAPRVPNLSWGRMTTRL